MTESIESKAVGGTVPDVSWVEKFGAVFEWTLEQNRLVNRQFDAAVKANRVCSIKKRQNPFLVVLVLTISIGVTASLVIVPTILRQPYEMASSNLIAGAILGGSGIGVVLLIWGWILGRFGKNDDAKWLYTTLRVGVENNVFWIYKHNTFYLFPNVHAFIRVTRVEDFVIANVTKTAAHFLPYKTLSQTEEGRKVLDWFEVNWPNEMNYELISKQVPRSGGIRRASKRLSMFLLVYGIACILILGVIYVSNQWQEIRNQEAFAKRIAPENQTLSGPAAQNFLDHLTNHSGK